MKKWLTILSLIAVATLSWLTIKGQRSLSRYHQCAPGEKNYTPGHRLALQRKTEGYDARICVGEQDWYDPNLLGKEAKDWLKAAGVSYLSYFRTSTWPKNHLSALVGFRMATNNRYEVCAYVNDEAGKHQLDGIINVAVGDSVRIEYRLIDDTAHFRLLHQDKEVVVSFDDFKSANKQVAVGPWHGGSLPAPVATGIWSELIWIDQE